MTTTPWRIGRGWSDAELRTCLAEMQARPVNYEVPLELMTPAHGWSVDGVTEIIARESAGPPLPDGPFARARQALIQYDFSDPRIVQGHFDPAGPLLGRTMLLDMKVLNVLRFLGGVRVHTVTEEETDDRTRFGFRYDTLVGHFERGFEWFLIDKQHATGVVCCQIEAHWQPGDFPTWWSRLGFRLLGGNIRAWWRRQAIARLRHVAHQSGGLRGHAVLLKGPARADAASWRQDEKVRPTCNCVFGARSRSCSSLGADRD